MTKIIYILIFILTIAKSANAQVANPTTIIFDHSDFAITTSYSVGYFSSLTSTTPVQEATFNKPSTCNPCTGLLPSRPTAFQTWYVGVRAISGTSTSAWSAPLIPFVRVVETPTNVRVQ